MSSITVDITKDHILMQSNPGDCKLCAIHKALSEKFPNRAIVVELSKISIGEKEFLTSPDLHGWQMGNIYNSERVKPFTLNLDTTTEYASIVGERSLYAADKDLDSQT